MIKWLRTAKYEKLSCIFNGKKGHFLSIGLKRGWKNRIEVWYEKSSDAKKDFDKVMSGEYEIRGIKGVEKITFDRRNLKHVEVHYTF